MKQSKRVKLTEFNRKNILSSAHVLFEAQGVSQTRMDDIALKADCSKSTLYVYFKSKDEIYYTLLYENMVQLKEKLKNSVSTLESFNDKYFSICETFVDFQKNHPLYFDGMLGKIGALELDFSNNSILKNIYTVGEEINDFLSDIIKEEIKNGNIQNGIEPIPTIFMMWASIGGIIKASVNKEEYLSDKNISKSDFLNYSFKLLLKTLIGGKQ